MSNVLKFPYDACRRVHSRKPRRSKNGTPEERAAAARNVAPASLMPLEMPLGGDTVYRRIAEHREAVAVYDRCVDAESDTSQAFDEMMFAARCLIIDIPTTRTGLIRWIRYVRSLLIAKDGSPYLPDEIGGKPWIDAFLRNLLVRLRDMGNKHPDEKRPRTSRRISDRKLREVVDRVLEHRAVEEPEPA
jgi:hypothetical protein